MHPYQIRFIKSLAITLISSVIFCASSNAARGGGGGESYNNNSTHNNNDNNDHGVYFNGNRDWVTPTVVISAPNTTCTTEEQCDDYGNCSTPNQNCN